MADSSHRTSVRRTAQRASRSRKPISYAEDSLDDDSFDEDADSEPPAPSPPTRSHTRRIPIAPLPPPPPPAAARSRPRGTSIANTRSPRKTAHKRSRSAEFSVSEKSPRKKGKHLKSAPKLPVQVSQDTIQFTGVIPPWHTLPYQILVDIFRYASYPLYSESTFSALPTTKWLVTVAHLCKAFTEPALTVLYTEPPLAPMELAHKLVDLLGKDPAELSFKYRQKVESLRIDVNQVAAHSLSGRGQLDLYSLVKNLPRLVDLEFYHDKDNAPYRDLDAPIKWRYPEALFDGLEFVNPQADPSRGDKTSVCKLRSWRWSSRLASKKYPIETIREIHLKPSFVGLRKIAFVNYQAPELQKGEDEPPRHEEILAKSLSVLTNLEHLIFESSTLVNSILLPLLPKNLRNLELINCWEVSAEDLGSLLLTHGSQLRCLTLNHNISLKLSFLPLLGEACPKLQVLRINLTYYNVHAFYNDAKPAYDKLLEPHQVPCWPATLQTIELLQLRQWDTDAAEMFFQSLLDSAANLPDLRHLTIQAILNIAWRDRAAFRDKWIGSLDRVFKRISVLPKPNMTLQTSQYSLPKGGIIPSAIKLKGEHDARDNEKRRSLRSATDPTSPSLSKQNREDDENDEDDEPPVEAKKMLFVKNSHSSSVVTTADEEISSRRYATRRRNQQIGHYAESPGPSEDGSPELSSELIRPTSPGKGHRMARELATLQQTAGRDGVVTPPESDSTEDSDDLPLVQSVKRKGKEKGKANEVIQGMCEVVKVRIDNLRPVETFVTEADFLDEEVSGDEDWDGDEDGDDGYAW